RPDNKLSSRAALPRILYSTVIDNIVQGASDVMNRFARAQCEFAEVPVIRLPAVPLVIYDFNIFGSGQRCAQLRMPSVPFFGGFRNRIKDIAASFSGLN